MAYETRYNTVIVPTTRYRSWSAPVTDVATAAAHNISVPYIHKNDILIKGELLRPYSRVYIMFDGVDVSALCKPLTANEYNTNAVGAAAVGTALNVGADGTLYARFYLPAGRFTAGEKLIHITDNLTTDAETCSADAVFTAKGNVNVLTPYIENVPTTVATRVWVPDPPVPQRSFLWWGWWSWAD